MYSGDCVPSHNLIKEGEQASWLSGFFTLTSDEAGTAVLILKYAKILFLSAGLGR